MPLPALSLGKKWRPRFAAAIFGQELMPALRRFDCFGRTGLVDCHLDLLGLGSLNFVEDDFQDAIVELSIDVAGFQR